MKYPESQAQLDVWAWKAELSEQLNTLPVAEWMRFLKAETHEMSAKLHVKTADPNTTNSTLPLSE